MLIFFKFNFFLIFPATDSFLPADPEIAQRSYNYIVWYILPAIPFAHSRLNVESARTELWEGYQTSLDFGGKF